MDIKIGRVKARLDGFVLSIIAAVVVAYFFPALGSKNSSFPLAQISGIGISMIFFFYGLKLSPEKIKLGLKNWKLHILVQSTTFVLFPLVVICAYPFIQTDAATDIWLGFLFLAALPSTVSASVVMVSIAKGNVPAAIFNASISGLIGVLITPLWMGLFITNQAADYSLSDIYFKLFTEIILPVILGIALQSYFGSIVNRHSKALSYFDKTVILTIIYRTFVHSFEDKLFSSVRTLDFIMIFVFVMLLFCLMYYSTAKVAALLGFSAEDQTTAQFCGTKKSLVHGTVFTKILFPVAVPSGIFLLPLIVFHASQIFIISVVAAKRGDGV